MKRSDINPMPEYFDRYIDQVKDVDLLEAFDESIAEIDALSAETLTRFEGVRYAADKWTVKENLQHALDWERIMAYRALLIARREGSVLAGVDETTLGAGMNANGRPVEAILDEMKALRRSTRAMFAGFDDEMLMTIGKSWKYEISPLALGFIIVGHLRHHLRIVDEKYLNTQAAGA